MSLLSANSLYVSLVFIWFDVTIKKLNVLFYSQTLQFSKRFRFPLFRQAPFYGTLSNKFNVSVGYTVIQAYSTFTIFFFIVFPFAFARSLSFTLSLFLTLAVLISLFLTNNAEVTVAKVYELNDFLTRWNWEDKAGGKRREEKILKVCYKNC